MDTLFFIGDMVVSCNSGIITIACCFLVFVIIALLS